MTEDDREAAALNTFVEVLVIVFGIGTALGLLAGMWGGVLVHVTGSLLPAIATGALGTCLAGLAVGYLRYIVRPRHRRRMLEFGEGEGTGAASDGEGGDRA